MKANTQLRRAARRIHVLLGLSLAGCLMNPLLDPHTALLMARLIVALTITFGWLIPGSWKRFVHRKPRRDVASAIRVPERVSTH